MDSNKLFAVMFVAVLAFTLTLYVIIEEAWVFWFLLLIFVFDSNRGDD